MNMSKSNLMESLARSIEVGNYSREDVPSEEEDNHQAQLNTINSLDPRGWSNQKEKILEASEAYMPNQIQNRRELINLRRNVSNPGSRLYEAGKK